VRPTLATIRAALEDLRSSVARGDRAAMDRILDNIEKTAQPEPV